MILILDLDEYRTRQRDDAPEPIDAWTLDDLDRSGDLAGARAAWSELDVAAA